MDFEYGTTLLNRGYTGHEHFMGVALIHMNGRMYDAKLGRFLSPDNFIQEPFSTQSFNRFGYVWNNPLKFTDPSGEIIWFVVAAVVIGGTMNVVSNWDKIDDFWDGLGYFTSGGVQGGLATLGPVGALAGGFLSSAANTAIQGGDIGEIFSSGVIGSVAGFAGGAAGKWAGKYLGNLIVNGVNIASPVIKGIVGGTLGGAVGGYVGGFTGGYLATGNLSKAHKAGLSSASMGASMGALAGGVGAYKWATDNKIDPWTGQKINGHHSFPKFMGGEANQKLTNIGEETHKQLHRDMNNFLKKQTDDFGNHMRPQRGNPGRLIQRNFNLDVKIKALNQFYKQNWFRYPQSTFDYYRNSNQFNLQWKQPFKK
nr:RHS repeat-associated core domain-containing protein [Tenacibaculum maritimum]